MGLLEVLSGVFDRNSKVQKEYSKKMSSFCQASAQNCTSKCCDADGLCPQVTGKTCFYAYNVTQPTQSSDLSPGIIAGISIGVVVLLAIVPLIVWWRKKVEKLKVSDSTDRLDRNGIRQKSVVKSQKKMQIQINILPADSCSQESPAIQVRQIMSSTPTPKHQSKKEFYDTPKIKSRQEILEEMMAEEGEPPIVRLEKYQATQPVAIYSGDGPKDMS